MKTLLLTLLTLLTTATLWAQAPQRISYQAIIRDGNNVVVASTVVGIKISVLRGTATGPAVYVETHRKTTNANGLVSLEIGEGTALSGTFAGIDWANGPYLIGTDTDPSGGTNYSISGLAPLNSVPYALNANTAGKAATLATPRAINGVSFDGSADITVAASAATLTGTIAIANGGTGATTATAARVTLGLENVDNTSDANKPVSSATQTALATKVDKVTGKGLSTNDYTTAEKTKLAAITGTNTGDQDLSALATTAAVAQKANATDVTTSLATKVDKVTGKELSTNDYSTAEKTKLAAITGTNTGDQTNITGNAATATKLLTAVTINGIAFDGSANVTIPATGAVPYTGATQAVDLGAYNLKVYGLTIGRGAGNVSTNTAVGNGALETNATGGFNTSVGSDALKMNTGSYNIAVGSNALKNNAGGDSNTAMGFGSNASHTSGSNNASFGTSALASNTGSGNTAIGAIADVYAGISNATAVGFQALATANNTIQLGNTSVTNVKTSGTITAGTVTYPNAHNSTAGQALTTNALGVASWTTPAAELPTSGNTPGDMLYWNGSAWVKVAAGSNGRTLTFYNSAPVWVETTANANTVFNPTTGKIWMDRNLGASQVATSSIDAASYGDIYQWGRGADGHQIRTPLSTPTTGQSSSSSPGANFLIGSSNWYNGTNPDNLWQGVAGVNNPCPTGYRIPTEAEWTAERSSWSANTSVGAFASPLKLPMAGYRDDSGGSLLDVGAFGRYWSSTVGSSNARYLYFFSSFAVMSTFSRASGLSVRCLKD